MGAGETADNACSKCGWSIEPDSRFCGNCGADIDEAPTAVSPPATETPPTPSATGAQVIDLDSGVDMPVIPEPSIPGMPSDGPDADVTARLEKRIEDIDQRFNRAVDRQSTELESTETVAAREPVVREVFGVPKRTVVGPEVAGAGANTYNLGRASKDEPSDCEDFRLEYNVARVFINGHTSSFNFCITAVSDDAGDCRDIRILVQSSGFLAAPIAHACPVKKLRRGRKLDIDLNLEPERSGQDIAGEVYLGYIKDGKRHVYYHPFQWDAYPPSEPPGKIMDNLSIRIGDVTPTADRAGDLQSSIKILDGLQQEGRYSSADELKEHKLPPAWMPLALFECDDWPMADESIFDPVDPPAGARLSSLTLRSTDGTLLHLVAGDEIQFGKNRECEIVTRIMDSAGVAASETNDMISRRHCRIEKKGVDCVLIDGDGRRQSTCGTFLDESALPHGGSRVLPLNARFSACLAGPTPGNAKVFGFEGSIRTCRAAGECGASLHENCRTDEPACLVLDRSDGVPETFAVVWRFCVLASCGENLTSKFGDIVLFRHKGAFAWRPAGGGQKCARWLVPGETLDSVDAGVVVEDLKQFGVWA